MNAGRELDALVAEKVTDDVAVYGGETVYLRGYQEKRLDGARERSNGGWKDPLPYSTDIAAAWTVVEAMHAKDQRPRISTNGESWFCQVMGPEGEGPHGLALHLAQFLGKAETPPLAICLAALKAVGVDVPE